MIAGAAVLGEQVAWHQPAGALLVILGIVISQDRGAALRTLVNRRRRRVAATRTPSAGPLR